MSSKAWDIYAQQLLPIGYGYPLWIPEPNLNSSREVLIGDIGWLNKGQFRALFNSMRVQDDPLNQEMGVPTDFEAFPSHNLLIRTSDMIESPIVFSRSISVTSEAQTESRRPGETWSFKTQSEAGAMVVLKPPGISERMMSRRHIINYMRPNFNSWLEFANASNSWGLGLRPEEVIFICGTLKTTQWAVAAFRGSVFRNKVGHISEQSSSIASMAFSVQISDHILPATYFRTGPQFPPAQTDSNRLIADHPDTPPSPGPGDQCLFINYYKMKRRLLWNHPWRAAAGPHQLPPEADNPGPEAISPGGARRAPPCEFGPDGHGHGDTYDPVNHLLDYILRTSEADIAIASDLDLTALFRDGTFPEDIPAALMKLAPGVEIDEHGVGMVSVDHSFAEMERVNNEKAFTYRGPEDMSQDLPANCSMDSPEGTVASSGPQSTPQDLAAPAQRTAHPPASRQVQQSPQQHKDGVDGKAARPGEDVVSPSGDRHATAVRDSTAGWEVPMWDRASMVAPRASPRGDGYLASVSDDIVRPSLVSVDA